jgi:transcription antitermination factor NusG
MAELRVEDAGHERRPLVSLTLDKPDQPFDASGQWWAIRTRSRAEHVVADRLAGQDCDVFLPRYLEPVEWSDRVHETRRPLFPGYLFARLDPPQRERANCTPGVAQILGEPIPASQIESVRIAGAATGHITPCSYRTGDLVRIESGPLTGCIGLVDRPYKNRLILRIDLLRRAISVEIDRSTRLRSLRITTPDK